MNPAPDQLPQPAKRSSKRWTAVALTSGAVVVAAGLGIAGYAQADPTPSPGAPSAAPSGQPGDPGRGGPGGGPGRHGDRGMGDLAQKLAEKLGVDQAKVETALKEVREANRPAKPSTAPSASPSAPTTPPTKPDPAARDAELAEALAGKLGVTEAKVKTALDEIRAERNADRAAALKTKLDAAVKAGTLTQAEADAVSKAVEKGVINVGPR